MSRFGSRRQLGALVGVVVLVGVGGWFAGTRVHSPADAAAAHRPPKAGPVTVGVELRSLTATVVGNGSVAFASPSPLSLAGPVGTGTSGGTSADGAEQRVTKAPVAGTKVKEGDVLMTVDGRPVIALTGTVPMYRTLRPGVSGDDVTQLQKALRSLGFDPGSVSGTFGQGTATAVTDWYKSKGYDAQQPSADDQQQLGQLQQAVSAAQQTLLTTSAGDPAANGDGSGSDAGHAAGSDAGAGTGSDAGDATATSAPTSTPSPQDTTAAKLKDMQVKSAQDALDLANAALSSFQASYGTSVPAGEVVFFPKLPVRLDKVTVKTGDVPSGQIGTVTSSDLVVQAVVPGSDAKLLRSGMAAEVTTQAGKKVRGTLTGLGADATSSSTADAPAGAAGGDAAAGGDSTDGAGASAAAAPVQLRISLPDPGPLAGQADAAVKVTIDVGASKGKVLTVPLAAVHTSSDGQARVQVLRGGTTTDVPVTLGLSAAGVVEVKPTGGTLGQGDDVVVGE